MKKVINPKSISPPASTYHHAILSQGISDLLTISGQLGEYPDGTCAKGAGAQAEQAWANVKGILDEADMRLDDIVKVTSYIVGEENIDAYVSMHREILGDMTPPWTLVVVSALGRARYLVEVDVLAARTIGKPDNEDC